MIEEVYAELTTLQLHALATRAYRRIGQLGFSKGGYWERQQLQAQRAIWQHATAELQRRGQAHYWWEKSK